MLDYLLEGSKALVILKCSSLVVAFAFLMIVADRVMGWFFEE